MVSSFCDQRDSRQAAPAIENQSISHTTTEKPDQCCFTHSRSLSELWIK